MTNDNLLPVDPADLRLRDLLDRYGCPTPFHAARTRLLAAVASPTSSMTPLEAVAALWGDATPKFATPEAEGDEQTTLTYLWEAFVRRQNTAAAFHLVPVDAKPTREELARLALVRREEIDAFVAGLFSGSKAVNLTKQASFALDRMADMRSMLQKLRNYLDDPMNDAPLSGLESSLQSVRDLTGPLEEAMLKVVSQCRAAREQEGGSEPPAEKAPKKRVLH